MTGLTGNTVELAGGVRGWPWVLRMAGTRDLASLAGNLLPVFSSTSLLFVAPTFEF